MANPLSLPEALYTSIVLHLLKQNIEEYMLYSQKYTFVYVD